MDTPATAPSIKPPAIPFALFAIVPAFVLPFIVAHGGKSPVLVFFGCWLFLLGIVLSIGRKRQNVKLSRFVIGLFYLAGAVGAATGIYLR